MGETVLFVVEVCKRLKGKWEWKHNCDQFTSVHYEGSVVVESQTGGVETYNLQAHVGWENLVSYYISYCKLMWFFK